MRDTKQFIEINRHLMTTREMADELGVTVPVVNGILVKNKWRARSEADRAREFILKNTDKSQEWIAYKLGYTIENIKSLCKGLGIKLKTEEQIKTEQHDELLKETTVKKVNRVKEAYTQSGSPFGLADKLRGVVTTEKKEKL